MEKRRGWLTNEGVIHYNRRKKISLFYKLIKILELSTLKSLPNGDTIVNDFGEGWDLILLDQNFAEKERLEGLGDPVPPYFRMVQTRVGDDERFMIWFRGEAEISIVNTMDFSARHINNFWNYRGVDARAIAAAIDSDATRLVGIGFLPGSNET